MNKWSAVIVLSLMSSVSAFAHPGHGEAPGTVAHLAEHAGLAIACVAVAAGVGYLAFRMVGKRLAERKRK